MHWGEFESLFKTLHVPAGLSKLTAHIHHIYIYIPTTDEDFNLQNRFDFFCLWSRLIAKLRDIVTMVLDPLSAFAVACNVLQVIELGVKVLTKAADYRKADNGYLAEQEDLRDVLQSLNSLNTNLSVSIPEQTVSNQLSVEESRLLDANCHCLRLSNEFIDFLDHLKLKDKNTVLNSLRISIKSLWHRDRMEAMEKSLSQARDNLNVAFLVYMKFVNGYRVYNTVMT